jgi:CRISPR/Cas system endoribonuclease Cas6 (RAMP superfamily)
LSAELCALTLRIDGLPPLSGWTGHWAQAWLLRWIGQSAPEHAARLHDDKGRKPYTVSPIAQLESGSLIRVTTLDPMLTAILMNPPPFSYAGVAYAVSESGRATSTFAELLRLGETGTLPLLHFQTPTAFRSQGMEINLPLPELVFGSLIHAWDSFSPLRLPLQLREFAAQHVTLTRHSIHTRRVTFRHRGLETQRTGFVGRVQFGVKSNSDPVAIRFLAALLHFAPYAGVGAWTTAGMGQVGLPPQKDGWHA